LGITGPAIRAAKSFLAHFPAVDHKARRAAIRARYLLRHRDADFHMSPGWTLRTPWEWANVAPEKIQLFFGYYDKSPWSRSGSLMALHGLTGNDRLKVQIRIFDQAAQAVRNIAESRAWNWQQGSMTQWLSDSERIIFNDVSRGQLVSRIVDANGHEESIVPFPIQTVHPNGLEAIALNYKRLWKLRPEYGYSAEVSNFSADLPLNQDGLWQVDLRSGSGKLLVTIAQLMEFQSRSDMNPERTKVNHAIVSPSGKRFAFMHHWFHGKTKTSRLYSMDWNGDHLRLILDSGMVSHYHWLDDERIVLYGNTPERQETYFHLNALDGSFEVIPNAELCSYGDGHPTYSPNQEWILSDCYPDRQFYQHLLLYRVQTQSLTEVGRFLHSPTFFGGSRCDLHPRFSPDGKRISFDSVFKGFRGSYIVESQNLP
jgi:hypothetical protein